MKIVTRLLAVSLSSFLLFLCLAAPASALNTMLSYEQYPPIVTEPTKPNVLVLISNDWTGFTEGYHDAYDNKVDYWGYFDNRKEYKYENSNYFSPVGIIGSDHYTTNNTYWSGNFLNWATMSHADFLRKALTGGRRSIDAVASTRLIRGLIPSAKGWKKSYTGADLNRLVPSTYAVSSYKFSNYGTEMDVTNSSGNSQIAGQKLSLEVEVCNEALPEKNCGTYSGVSKPEGLLQHYKDKMLFGLMSYSHSIQDQGGIVRQLLGDISSHINSNGQLPSSGNSILRYINNYTEKGWDPLAEMYYDAVRYLRGNTAAQAAFCPSSNSDDGYGFYGCADSTNNRWIEPVLSWCQKSSIVIINDEYPSREHDKIPYSAFNPGYRDTPKFAAGNTPYNPNVVELLAEITQLEGLNGTEGELAEKVGNTNNTCRPQTIDNLANFKGICPAEGNSQGTFSLAALAYDAFKNDMRSDLDNKQSFRTYAIAFRATSGTYEVPKPPLNQMYLAGKYGNFDDMNGNGVPDLPEEWMKGADLCTSDNPESDNCLPKGFFYAEGGDAIEKALKEVVESILRRSASGTAVSVLATSGKGEGNLVQAYYRPARLEPTADGVSRDVVWTGYLQSLWIDKYGNMREDSDNDQQLDVTKDKIIKFIIDTDGSTKVSRYAVSSDIPFPATNDTSTDQIEMGDVKVVWEAGARLAATASADRNIFTGIDLNFDGVVDKGESLPFTTASTAIRPYLALQDLTPENGTVELGKEEDTRINNLIAFIRGDDWRTDPAPTSFIDTGNTKMRDRRIGGKVWKLGDIVNSTPISIAAPPDRFDLIYGDASYGDFYNFYKNRETVVYVGANDGMLHAFTSWQYNKTTQKFEDPYPASNKPIGSELWAYIPQSLLPHLKWLTRPEYTHVFYMDMQPRIFDARIFAVDAAHPNGWGTVMVVGMNTGGGLTTVQGDFNGTGTLVRRDFNPSYMAFDITEPRNPKLLWEKAYDGLGFTRAIPTVMRVKDDTESKWFLVFGNGPDAGTLSAGTDPNYKGESITNGRIYIVDLATGAPYTGDDANTDWWKQVADPRAFFNAPTAYDRYLNFSVDAAYMATTYNNQANSNQPADWKGSVYRILTLDSTADQTVPTYKTDPTQWSLQKLFNSPRPITAPGALSIDHNGNTWAYFGTGRYLNNKAGGDENTMNQEYLIGIKDPFFNKSYKTTVPAYYQNFEKNRVLEVGNLLNATPIAVLTTGAVKCSSADPVSYSDPVFDLTLDNDGFLPAGRQPCPAKTGTASTFNNLLSFARAKDGWIKALPVGDTSAERSLNKPAVVGGLALFSTYLPTGDDCSYGGESTLYAPYYETGTAFKKAVFQGGKGVKLLADGSGVGRILDSYSLGDGSTSSVGVHLGQQNDNADSSLSGDMATGFVQQGSGNIIDFDFETALKVRSGMRSWVERRD